MRGKALVLGLALALGAPGAQGGAWARRLWRASQVAVVAASAGDAASSWGRRELNPMLAGGSGRFGARGLGIKLGILGGAQVAQELLVRRATRAAAPAAAVNFGVTGLLGCATVHNLRGRR